GRLCPSHSPLCLMFRSAASSTLFPYTTLFRSVAAVMVTARLPAFARPGQTVDVVVSSMGNAKSLRGGTLLMTPLKGADGQVYARSEEHTSELQSRENLVCRLLLEKKK